MVKVIKNHEDNTKRYYNIGRRLTKKEEAEINFLPNWVPRIRITIYDWFSAAVFVGIVSSLTIAAIIYLTT